MIRKAKTEVGRDKLILGVKYYFDAMCFKRNSGTLVKIDIENNIIWFRGHENSIYIKSDINEHKRLIPFSIDGGESMYYFKNTKIDAKDED